MGSAWSEGPQRSLRGVSRKQTQKLLLYLRFGPTSIQTGVWGVKMKQCTIKEVNVASFFCFFKDISHNSFIPGRGKWERSRNVSANRKRRCSVTQSAEPIGFCNVGQRRFLVQVEQMWNHNKINTRSVLANNNWLNKSVHRRFLFIQLQSRMTHFTQWFGDTMRNHLSCEF